MAAAAAVARNVQGVVTLHLPNTPGHVVYSLGGLCDDREDVPQLLQPRQLPRMGQRSARCSPQRRNDPGVAWQEPHDNGRQGYPSERTDPEVRDVIHAGHGHDEPDRRALLRRARDLA